MESAHRSFSIYLKFDFLKLNLIIMMEVVVVDDFGVWIGLVMVIEEGNICIHTRHENTQNQKPNTSWSMSRSS